MQLQDFFEQMKLNQSILNNTTRIIQVQTEFARQNPPKTTHNDDQLVNYLVIAVVALSLVILACFCTLTFWIKIINNVSHFEISIADKNFCSYIFK